MKSRNGAVGSWMIAAKRLGPVPSFFAFARSGSARTGAAGAVALALTMIMAVFPATPLWAQEARGTITGKVLDSTGAVVPNAAVKVGNVAMGTSISVTSNDSGFFAAPFLVPGTYEITVEVRGFKRYVSSGIVLHNPWLSNDAGGSGSAGVITAPTNADFGKIANISNQANYARRVQLGIKFIF